ncbi:hypothetical protein I309_04731 [Cryptococcus deuterogattii LA55]|nr:hypothetical protein I309_04731 [Cryptococcus deuterogattii LA55]KIR69942.1 hypothetical protein I310_06257 [Cryptococcus deuterogattii CA1014]KIR89945.1 hypothetical protein I304_06192 [Cryptococcus deuterogattii CBS 10090]KIR98672.1 hypothetical protein L804_04250 [Cryptococcus deuterogattii 2001/935-1]
MKHESQFSLHSPRLLPATQTPSLPPMRALSSSLASSNSPTRPSPPHSILTALYSLASCSHTSSATLNTPKNLQGKSLSPLGTRISITIPIQL